MSQRNALLAIHGSLPTTNRNDGTRAALFDELSGSEYRSSVEQQAATAVAGGSHDTAAQTRSGSGPSAAAQNRAAQKTILPPGSDVQAETIAASTDQVVLDAEVLEAIVSVAIGHELVGQLGDTATDRAAFTNDPALVALAERLVVDSATAPDLLGVVYDRRQDENLTAVGSHLVLGDDGRAVPQRTPPAPHLAAKASAGTQILLDTPPTVLDIARTALIEAGIDLVPGILQQPGTRCQARLVPVELGGDGEYAISFRTDVCFEMPADLDVADFVADLFEPSKWPERNSFWISMEEIPEAEWTDAGRDLVARMEQAQQAGQAAGATYGQRRLYNEEVGNRNNEGGTWPGTVLVFTGSHRPGTDGRPNHHYLEYRLVPGISNFLLLDDGTIQVAEDGTNVCCTITKMLFFSEERHSTQAEVMADYACISGWADQTRTFLMNWIDHKRTIPGGTQ